MNSESDQREVWQLVESSLREFRDGMQVQEQLAIHIGRRTTHIIRFALVGLIILGIAMLLLTLVLTKDMQTITEQMRDMAFHMSAMKDDVELMTGNTGSMDRGMVGIRDSMQSMDSQLIQLTTHVEDMNASVGIMAGHTTLLAPMTDNVHAMSQSMHILQQEIDVLNHSVGRVSYDVNHISRPIKMFPFPGP